LHVILRQLQARRPTWQHLRGFGGANTGPQPAQLLGELGLVDAFPLAVGQRLHRLRKTRNKVSKLFRLVHLFARSTYEVRLEQVMHSRGASQC
jgi:hypothetical protein